MRIAGRWCDALTSALLDRTLTSNVTRKPALTTDPSRGKGGERKQDACGPFKIGQYASAYMRVHSRSFIFDFVHSLARSNDAHRTAETKHRYCLGEGRPDLQL